MERLVTIRHPEGLHARPAAELVRAATLYQSRIEIVVGDRAVSANSLLSVLELGVRFGQTVLLRVEGPDADKAAHELTLLLERQA